MRRLFMACSKMPNDTLTDDEERANDNRIGTTT
jgi:hypothetical protein